MVETMAVKITQMVPAAPGMYAATGDNTYDLIVMWVLVEVEGKGQRIYGLSSLDLSEGDVVFDDGMSYDNYTTQTPKGATIRR